nr:hypothetical protein [Tanacetum cinerariifolium]
MLVYYEWDGVEYIKNTETGQSSRLSRGDDEDVMVTEVSKHNMENKDAKRSIEVDDDVFIDQDKIIEDVDVDMEDFRETYVRNISFPIEEEPQDEELDLDDFDGA